MSAPLPYVYRWDRQGRKGEPCDVLIRAKAMNSCLIRFADGYTMVTSRNAIRKNREVVAAEQPSDLSDQIKSEKSDAMSDEKSETM